MPLRRTAWRRKAALDAEERAALARLNALLDRPSDSPVNSAAVPPRIAGLALAYSAGGMLSSTLLTLIVIPAIYSIWKEREVRRVALRRISGSAEAV